MKILLYGIGKYTGEMAAWLAARGHQVRVVTAPPYYPDCRFTGAPCHEQAVIVKVAVIANAVKQSMKFGT
ncbi:MAG: glycosyltransferase [Rhodoferax sp.]